MGHHPSAQVPQVAQSDSNLFFILIVIAIGIFLLYRLFKKK